MNYYKVTCECGKIDSLREEELSDLARFCTECGSILPSPVRDLLHEGSLSDGLKKFEDEREI